MTSRKRLTPQEVQKIAAYAPQLPCHGCGAKPGTPCTEPGKGRSVCKNRWGAAAIELSRQARAARRTPAQAAEQAAILAALPRIPREEIEARRTPAGGYSFTRAWFLEHGLPYPPIPGWRQAVQREEDRP